MTGRRRRLRKVAATATSRADARASNRLLREERRRQRAAELHERRAIRERYRQLGGRRGQRRRLAGRVLFEHRPDAVELSTGVLEAVYPFQVASPAAGPAPSGIAVGPSPTGGTFAFDPWMAYRAGVLSNPNMLILGDVGSGKSALAKTLVWRGLEFGRGAHVVDPKGEYAPLAAAAGTEPIVLRPGGGVVINPLDPGAASKQLSGPEVFHRNLSCVRALLEATLDRRCRQLEMVLAAAALARICGLDLQPGGDASLPTVADHGQTATLTMLADALVDPPADVSAKVNMDHGRVVEESREMALALARLVDDHGDLAGMFAGHTNVDVDALGDLVVVDISAVHRNHRQILPLVMVCTAAWLQVATEADGRGRFQINDEAWALLADEATARWTQTNQKLSRHLSLSVVNVMHRLSDTAAAGDAGTATRSLAEGVIADSGTWVVYRQRPSERDLLAHVLQLNDIQTHLATHLARGRGLWITAGQTRNTTLVDHVLSPTERRLVDTDQHMHGADPDLP